MRTRIVRRQDGVVEVEDTGKPWATDDEDGFIDNGGDYGGKTIRYLTIKEAAEWERSRDERTNNN